jgi:hypothetical protein
MKSFFTGLLRVNETGIIVFVKDAMTNALIDTLTARQTTRLRYGLLSLM